MAELKLAPEGLFPLPETANGATTLDLPIAGTIQGEGLLAGVPSLFLRLAGCNMFCTWNAPDGSAVTCDTKHALATPSSHTETTEELLEKIARHRGKIDHLVVTGGEPLLQAEALVTLLAELRLVRPPMHVTLESNGSLYAPELLPYVDLWSFSPKLYPNFLAGWALDEAGYTATINRWLQALPPRAEVQLKFVVGTLEDEAPLLRFLGALTLSKNTTVLLMPLGATQKALELTTPPTLELCLRHGFRFAPRLQIMLWGDKVGV